MIDLGRMVWAEICYRRWSAVCTAAIAMATVATVVFFMILSELAAQRTQIIQRDIGLNLRIIPADTNLEAYWIKGYAEGVMDQSLLSRIAEQEVANRLVPMLQRTIPWGDGEAILTGVGEELFSQGQQLKPVFGNIQEVQHGLTLGSVAAQRRGLGEGDRLLLFDQEFTVQKVLASTGSVDDVRVYGQLAQVQQLLGLPGKLNEIRALECHCEAGVVDPEAYLQSILQPLLPGTLVIRQDRIADARRKQREMIEQVGILGAPVLILLSTVALLGLALLNVQHRRSEIGLLASVGRSAAEIGCLIGFRSAALGIVGGLSGAWLGWQIATAWGGTYLGSASLVPAFELWRLLIGGALGGLLASMAALVPAVLAARTDPATSLRGS